MKGAPRAASAKHLDTMNDTDKVSLCLRLCFFLTKVARIHIRYKGRRGKMTTH